MKIRYGIFSLLFFGFYFFIFEQGNPDWSENLDPKHDLRLYGDLEEGGEEGGDDE